MKRKRKKIPEPSVEVASTFLAKIKAKKQDEIEERLFNTFMRGWHTGASAAKYGRLGVGDAYSRGYDAGVRALQAARKLARKSAITVSGA